jgi:hypothetical protein
MPKGEALPARLDHLRVLTLSLHCIAHPDQLNHGVGKGKAPTGRTLPRMLIWRPLMQTKLNKFFRLGAPGLVQTSR